MIHRLRAVLEDAGVELSTHELLDVLWLAAKVTAGPDGGPAPDGESEPPVETGPETEILPAPDEDDNATDDEEEIPPQREGKAPAGLYVAAGPRTGTAMTPARTVDIRGVRALPSPRALSRALRPLRQRVPSRRLFRLDESASADWIAETGLPDAVLRPERERWLSINLVVDDGPSMVLWRQLAAELRSVLEHQGTFREVRTFGLDSSEAENPILRAQPFASGAPRRSYGHMADPSGRTAVLVLSDGVGPGWRSGAVQRLLARWALRAPVAAVQPLPRRMWPESTMPAERLLLRTVRRAAPNRALSVSHPVLPPGLQPPYGGLPIPVLELTGAQMGAWAALVGNEQGSAELPVMFWERPSQSPPPMAGTEGSTVVEEPLRPSPEERVRGFYDGASPEGRRLAGHLASVFPLTLPVMRLVHQASGDHSTGFHPAQLAEVFLGGLLSRRDHTPGEYEFHPGVADLLLDTVRTDEAVGTVDLVTAFLKQRQGAGPDFRARVTGVGGGVSTVSDQARPFAAASRELLHRLGLPRAEESEADGGDGASPLSHASDRVLPPLIRVLRRFEADETLPGAVRSEAEAVLATTDQRDALSGWKGVSTVQDLAVLLVAANLRSEADELRTVVREQLADLRDEDLETRNLRGHLALALNRLGDHDEAVEHLRRVVEISGRVHGVEHDYTLFARAHLAGLLQRASRYEEAEAERRALVEVYERRKRDDRDSVHQERIALGQALASQGRHEEAVAEYRGAYEGRLHALSPEHPETLRAQMWVAFGLEHLGHIEEAEAEYRRVADARSRLHGSESEETLAARSGHAGVLRKLGRHREAESELRALVADHASQLGPDHPTTISVQEDLAQLLSELNRPAEAEAEIRQVIRNSLRVFGKHHRQTLRARGILAGCLNDLNRYAEAESEYRAVLADEQRSNSSELLVLGTRNQLAHTLHDLKRYDEAEAEYRTVAMERSRLLGPDHRLTLSSCSNWAMSLHSLGRHDEAEAEFQRVLAEQRRVLGDDDRGVLITRTVRADSLNDQGRSEEAEKEYRALVILNTRHEGADAAWTLRLRHALGFTLNKLRRFEEAESENRATWESRKGALGDEAPLTLTTRHNLAFSLHGLGRLDEAEAEYEAVLEARSRVLGPDHGNTVITRNRLVKARQDRAADRP
ncbi:SAV_2336 N-terminal domain-related protein [Streptomyces sp. IB2014 016-6]|uniref:SAV_2336 N-terminal domain-related protein n=1 Tax=Streptomyces sp. IB2014 016-6 TaxID=2517818 RepID=UPI0011CCD493|nr:SAV_2336 N-terminal domain-related protein [Streptomyces sp. IB2014 016-6]TXL89893.1 tetratricopeptide repeat protein [Streptomyces sp. IB2014 016-6]